MNIRDARWQSLTAFAALSMLWGAKTEGAEITFDQVNNSGIISHTAGGPMVGMNIVFQSIVGTGTENDDTIDCDGCLLNFTTGNVTSVVGNEYTFAAGGTFTLTGGSVAAGIPGGTTLLTGSFSDPITALVVDGAPGGQDVFFFVGLGLDQKHADLLAYFFPLNPPENWFFIDSTIQITVSNGVVVGPGGDFTANLAVGGNADLVNTSLDVPEVPEPGSSLLLLLGLGSLAAYRRRG